MSNSPLLSLRVQAMRYLADGVVGVELAAPDGAALPAFTAGAHVDLHLPNGLVRSYSLFGKPDDASRYVVGVLRDRASRGGSAYVHEQLRVGAMVPVSIPRNHFALVEDVVHTVLVAGGIGITPLRCMLDRLRSLDKPVDLLYCARSRSEAAFAAELLASPGVTAHFDSEAGGPPDLRAYLAAQPADAHFYCCGPAPMLAAFESICAELGLPNVHVERFAAAGPVEAVQASGYQAHLARSDKTVTVPAGKSLLDALLEAGVRVDYSCREGVCGSCETRVLEGVPEHRDGVLSKGERASGKTMIVCVSGCKGSRLVLDL